MDNENNILATTTAEVTISKTREEIVTEALRIEEGAMYSSKGHFAASRIWSNFHLIIGVPMVVFSAIAGASILKEHETLAGIFAITVTVLSGLLTFLNPNERASKHLSSANHYDSLQNHTRIFRTIDCKREESDNTLTGRLNFLSEQKEKLNLASPQISFWAYKIAKRSIDAGEADFSVDKKK